MAPALPAGSSPAPGPREEEGRILQKETGGPIKWQLGKLQGKQLNGLCFRRMAKYRGIYFSHCTETVRVIGVILSFE